jgi:DNA uptake protein ComE-like DNA-binding protein
LARREGCKTGAFQNPMGQGTFLESLQDSEIVHWVHESSRISRKDRKKPKEPLFRLFSFLSAIRFMESSPRCRLRSIQEFPQGFVLLLVLVIVMLASMVAASVLFLLRSEKTASAAGVSGEQAWATALSGVYQAMRIASRSPTDPSAWQDNAAAFKNQLVVDDGANRWYFSVYSISDPGAGPIRFGLNDEASRINVTHADVAVLERVPNLTPALAQVLVDYAQTGRAILPSSTNELSFRALTNRVSGTDRKLGCLDELLSVPGVNNALLYGEDANLNGHIDPAEDDGDASAPSDNQDSQLELGLRALLTVFSYDLNVREDGQPRQNLNDPKTDLSNLELPESVLTYLEAMRRQGQKLAHPADLLEASGQFKDQTGAATNLSSGVSKAELPLLLDRCSTTNETRLAGRVNLNTASAKVLAALPGIDAALAEAIVSARVSLSDESRRTPAWLYQEGLVTADLFKKLAPHLTTRSYQFHFHVLAYGVPAGTYRVIEAVIDTAVQPPAILLLRDLTRLGLPVGMDTIKEPARPLEASNGG